MSGIAVVVNADGRPVEPELLSSMAEALKARGPDAQRTWTDGGPIGVVHALFQTTEDDVPRAQPFSLDGKTWIVADARIDARGELADRLRGHGCQIEPTTSGAELLLHAWHIWDSDCVGHLLGDFSFIVVDTSQRRVFAARDHFGVKPMFYARAGDGLVITNDLDCARLHPQVRDTLDDSWVCDFLLFAWNTDVTATVFRDIRRLPGGHRLEWTPSGLKIERYWSISIPEEVWLPHPNDYVERFNDVFEKAVADRLRTKRVSIAMSGGLDSTAIAATAVHWARKHAPDTHFRSFTHVWDPVLPKDREREFATEAAQFLGIPINFIEGSDHHFFGKDWNTKQTQGPEPIERGCLNYLSLLRSAAAHSRILLNGDGGDEALGPHPTYYLKLLAERRYGRWFADVYRHLRWQRQLPRVGLRTAVRRLLGFGQGAPNRHDLDFPQWLSPNLVIELNLRDKWDRFWSQIRTGSSDTPAGHYAVTNYLLPYVLGWHDAAGLYGPVEYRFPWLDLRVIQTCWSFPPVPMRFAKYLLRTALQGKLPAHLLERRKVGLGGDPLVARASEIEVSWDRHMREAPGVTRYVSTDPMIEFRRTKGNSNSAWLNTRPLELCSWLQHWSLDANRFSESR